MKCPKCGEDTAYLNLYEIIDGNSRIADYFYVALILLQCPCGYRRFNQLHFTIPFFPKTELSLYKWRLNIIELGGAIEIIKKCRGDR